MKRVLVSIAAAFSLLAGSLLVSTPAHAVTYSSKTWSPTGISKYRVCPSAAARCDHGYYLHNGSRVRMICYRDGEWATGAYRSNRWFLVEAQGARGRTGWVHSSLVYWQTRVGRC